MMNPEKKYTAFTIVINNNNKPDVILIIKLMIK